MITLKQIWEEIKDNKYKETEKDDFEWKPVRKDIFTVPDFVLPETRKQESLRTKLSKVLAFIDMEKYLRFSQGCTIIPVSCNNKRLKSICGNSKEVSRLIQFMKQIGLLKDEDTSYQFNSTISNYNKSKTYQYFYDNEIKIKEYCTANNIYIYRERNYKERSYIDTVVDIFAFEPSQVKFSSKLHLLKPTGMSNQKFEDILTSILYDNYPELSEYQKLADRINDTFFLDYPEFQVSYRPTFTWSKGDTAVRKIGIRATNQLSNVETEERKEKLKEYGMTLSKDVKSSVPRLSMSLTYGYWLPEDIDLYELIWNQYTSIKESEVNEINIDTVVDTFAETRESIKHLTLPAYFDYDDTRLGSHIRNRMNNKADKDDVYNEMNYLQQAVRRITGNCYDNEIFYHESNIYMKVLFRLLDEGYLVWQVYDSWYAKGDSTQEEYEKHVTELVAKIANEYLEGFRNGKR